MSSDETLALEIHKEEVGRFQFEVEVTNKELYKGISLLNSGVELHPPIIIDKHDSMTKQIDDIIALLNTNTPILLVGKSKTLNRLISVVELVKTKVQVQQYNKLIQQSSVKNPNHKPSNMTNPQKQNLQEDIDPKIYLLPILFVYLVPKKIKCEIDWTEN